VLTNPTISFQLGPIHYQVGQQSCKVLGEFSQEKELHHKALAIESEQMDPKDDFQLRPQ
jgi:hypothetical protein